ncbi:MAG: aldehyde dehydrogenase family protein [Lachnospiraceae bacterium]|nr:aldehyde dehydrogenase family protein [Lachnospiraceae bacterium]
MNEQEYLRELVAKARVAQAEFETYPQERVDAACRAVCKVIYDNAEELARMAVDETGMGRYDSKIAKCRNKSKTVWYGMKGKKSRGIIEYDEATGIAKVAKPIGVIGSVAPTTNPVITLMHNSACAMKCGNAVIISPHPRAKNTAVRTVQLMNEALAKLNMPENLIQLIPEPTIELSAGLMGAVDLCICTGGPSMVRAAYSSGKPAIGVGQGNVQVLIDRDVDVKSAVEMVIDGRTFDNGVLCTCEQNMIVPEEKRAEVIEHAKNAGAYMIDDPKDAQALRDAMFPFGKLNKDVVGATPQAIGALAGLEIPEGARCILCRTEGIAFDEVLAKEKLCPVLALFTYDTWENAVEIARANLNMEGAGHSCVIHSNNKDHVEYVTRRVNVSRYAVNQVGGTCLGGALTNGLNPTTTLGCGTWGNNSISENIYYHNLMNVSRVSYVIKDGYIPTDEEIWAE